MTDRSRTQRTALRPMASMAETILELRESGQGELADALTRLREAWARAVAKHPHRHVPPSDERAAALLAAQLTAYAAGHTDLQLLVLHTCQAQPVAVRAFADGFQPTPWPCAGCSELVEQDALRYELREAPRNGAAA
jgi:hypothetical protein